MAPEAAERLSVQLSTLSELLETITYRLLELEERVAAQDLKIQGLEEQLLDPAAVASGLSDDAELRLEDTEERLSQLEALLNGMGSPAGAAAARHLQPVPHQVEEMVASDDPFPEEGEQPFMDELDGDPDDHLEETA
jgi:chromosome segregation ATPase